MVIPPSMSDYSRCSSSRTTANFFSRWESRASERGTLRISTSRPTLPSARIVLSMCPTATRTAASPSSTGMGKSSLTFIPGSTDVLVADRENSRLQLFDKDGTFRRQWVGVKDAATTGRVFAVAADAARNYYVGIRRADYDSQHTGVVKLDRDWRIVASVGFGQPGHPVFNAVHDLALGKDGSIYVEIGRAHV